MPQSEHAVISSDRKNRTARKARTLSGAERQKAMLERRKLTHKEIKVQIPNEYKHALNQLCESEGLTQAEMIVRLIEMATANTKD